MDLPLHCAVVPSPSLAIFYPKEFSPRRREYSLVHARIASRWISARAARRGERARRRALDRAQARRAGGGRSPGRRAAQRGAEAVRRLCPGVKVAIGPALENGFYSDFDFPQPIAEDDLARIEQEIGRELSEGRQRQREEIDREQARARFL